MGREREREGRLHFFLSFLPSISSVYLTNKRWVIIEFLASKDLTVATAYFLRCQSAKTGCYLCLTKPCHRSVLLVLLLKNLAKVKFQSWTGQ